MNDILSTVVSSIFSGGMTGILGVIVQRIADYQNKKLDLQLITIKNDHEIQLKEVDAEIMREEWAQRTRIAEIEEKGQEAVSDSEAFEASFNEPQRYSVPSKHNTAQNWLMVLLDTIRGLVRPVLTVYLCILTTLIYLHSRSLLNGVTMTTEQAISNINLVVGTVLYLTTTCVLWWFGTRNKQKQPKIK